jgi:hypothetical protein
LRGRLEEAATFSRGRSFLFRKTAEIDLEVRYELFGPAAARFVASF